MEQKEAAGKFSDFVQRPENQQKVVRFGFRPGNSSVKVADPISTANGVDPTQPQTVLPVPDARVMTKLLSQYEPFAAQYPQVLWRSMKGMRNRLAHGYFDINLDVVWDTVQTALPGLLAQLPAIRDAALALDRDNESGVSHG